MSLEIFMENTETATFNWKKACQGNDALMAFVIRTVVKDQDCPRIPDEQDMATAWKQFEQQEKQPLSLFQNDHTQILPAAPNGPEF